MNQSGPSLSIVMMVDMAKIDILTIINILRAHLQITNYVKMVRRGPTREYKENTKNIYSDITERFTAKSDLIERVVTYDESYIFLYNLETKRQLMH